MFSVYKHHFEKEITLFRYIGVKGTHCDKHKVTKDECTKLLSCYIRHIWYYYIY